jgi:sulfur-carrier protein
MASTVRIPTPLRVHTGGKHEVEVAGESVAEIIENLEANHPGIRAKLLDDKGVRRFVNIFVGEDDIRFMEGLSTPVADGSEVAIIPAIAGGC